MLERHDVPKIHLKQPREDRTRFVDNGGMDPDTINAGARMMQGAGDGELPCPPEPME